MRYANHDDALKSLAHASPELRNGAPNHAPMVVEALSERSGYEFGVEEPRDMGRACISIPLTILSSFYLPYWRKRGPPRIERQDRVQEFSKVNEMIRNTQQNPNMSLDTPHTPALTERATDL
jgi:hypothetical protein